LAREYKEKLELLKFEREKLALKEEQFIRCVQKTEATQKAEIKKAAVTFEQKLQARSRDMERKVEDLEDKLNSTQDEAEELRSKVNRLESLNQSQRQSLEEWQRKEDRLILQYDKLLDGLRSEIRDKEREAHALETRWAQSKQEVVN
jgi:TolA-binding protein